jgi:hypothetical protein
MNLQAVRAIYIAEMARTWRTLMQSIISPVISTSLYFIVFGAAIGSRISEIDGVSYGAFIVPGLIMLQLLTQSISNAAIGIYFPKDTKPLSDFRAVHRQNTFMYEDVLDVRPGDVTSYGKFEDPIELLFIDLAKHWTVCDFVTRSFFPSLIPGHSVVIQQDYLFGTHTAWLHVTMEYLAPYFEIVGDTNYNSVVFLHTKAIPPDVINRDIVQSLSRVEIKELSDKAVSRFTGHKRELLESSRDHFLGEIDKIGWKA